jgi:hypothetical protein
VKEPHSNFCGKCRQWIVSEERAGSFSEVEGVKQALCIWICPACRGEAGAEVKVARGPVMGADISKDERLGPYRDVAERLGVNASGKTERVRLKECGHEACVSKDAKGVRCRRCAKKSAKAEDKEEAA